MEDFRRADPTYVNFVPKTCAEAIDLFTRHRRLGLMPDLYPECFVHCSRKLPPEELDKFHRFIVAPTGDVAEGGGVTEIDRELEAERQQLLQEAARRDLESLRITEEKSHSQDDGMQVDETEEKTPDGVVIDPNYMLIAS